MYCLIKAFHYWINKQKYIYNICTPSWMCLFSLLDWKNICAHLLLTTGWCCCAVSLHLIIYYIDFHLFISLILTVIYYTHTHTHTYVWMSRLLYWLSGVQLWVNVRSVLVWIRSINQPPLVFYHGGSFQWRSLFLYWANDIFYPINPHINLSASSSRVKCASSDGVITDFVITHLCRLSVRSASIHL